MLSSIPTFRNRLLKWYAQHARLLPWRTKTKNSKPVDPYFILLSELMLQQTQVKTVVPYFERFVAQLPTIESLADAGEQTVLRLWQGLGYYRRARHLHKTAISIVRDFDGSFPQNFDDLLKLPGVGRYTAGAIASIAFDQRAPIVDGNVARVICRLDAIQDDPKSRAVIDHLWKRAGQLVPDDQPGRFNSALMELGALVCTPRNPDCESCPVRRACSARSLGIENQIPVPKARKANPVEKRIVHIVERSGRFLFEQRPANGRWAGMWQFVTRKPDDESFELIEKLAELRHELTHRRYEFVVWRSKPKARFDSHWMTLDDSESLPLPKPHLRIRDLIKMSRA